VLRRITGGRAVWHHRELTYSLATPLPSPLFPPSLIDTVAAIGRALAIGLQQLGLPVQIPSMSPGPSPRKTADLSPSCFAEPAWYEVRIQGKKIIGSAQRRWRDRFLQQGSILLRHDPHAVAQWLPVDPGALQTAAGLEDFLTTPVAADRLAGLLARSLASTWGIEFQPGELTAEETALAEQLARNKYGGVAWTLHGARPSPARP
jgi:lipoate-protein ligase A